MTAKSHSTPFGAHRNPILVFSWLLRSPDDFKPNLKMFVHASRWVAEQDTWRFMGSSNY